MNTEKLDRIIDDLCATAEVMGYELKPIAAAIMADELAMYQLDAVQCALRECMRDLRGRLTLADILDRLQADDGRPTANEAWADAVASMDETETVILTAETAEAMGAARLIYRDGDEVGARMAFRDSYDKLVKKARAEGKAVSRFPSLGTDKGRRQSVVQAAVEQGLLSRGHLDALPDHSSGAVLLLESARKIDTAASKRARDAILHMLGHREPHQPLTAAEERERRAELARQVEALRSPRPKL